MGGLVGLRAGGTVMHSYYDTRTSRWTTSAGGVGRTTEQLQQPWKAVYEGIYASWNLDLDGDGSPDDPWDFGAPDRYPKLKSPNEREQDVKTFILTPQVRFIEGRSAELTINLNRPAPAGGVAFMVTPNFNDATLMNEVMSITSPVTVAAGDATVDITVSHTPDDRLTEPDKTFTLTVAATTAGWSKAGDGWDTATVTVDDDDPHGLRFERTGGRLGEPSVRIAEGGTGTYGLSMASRILSDVTITVRSDDPGAVTVSPESHTFTPSNWETMKTFTVSGVVDEDADNEAVHIRHWKTNRDGTDGAFWGSKFVAVTDTTSPQQSQEAPADYADLIARMKEWRNDPRWVSEKAHTDRWDRALLAFGETVADATLTAMTAAEAQAFADRGSDWSRWVEVAAALRELEAGEQQPTNEAPTVSAAIADAIIVSESGTRQVSLSGVFTDADNDALTVTAASSAEAVATVSVASDQSSLTVTAKARGTATITVTAADGRGGTVDDPFTVTVKAAPVVASSISDVSGLEVGDTRDVSLSGVFSDADGDSLTITAASSDETKATVSVSADYSTLTLTGVSVGTGTVTVTTEDPDGNRVSDTFDVEVAKKYAALIAQMYKWREDPQWRHRKSHTDRWDRALLAFGETVSDTTLSPMTAAEAQSWADSGLTRWVDVAAALREIEAAGQQPNQAPTVSAAIADATIVSESGTHAVSLSGVFSDADNDALTITAASSDDTVATVAVASDGSSLTVNAQGRGTATITVTAADGSGGTVEDTFTVTVKAAPVVASSIADLSLQEGGSKDISLSGVFSDADGDALTITTDTSNDAVSNGWEFQGTLTVAALSAGAATITVTAQDTDGNRVTDAFDVEVAAQQQPTNQAPTVSAAIGDLTIVSESGTKQVSLSGVFDDADSDALTITAASSDEAKATVAVTADQSSLTVSAKSRGEATITVTANDGNGGAVDDAFTVMVKAAPVVASSIGDVSGLEAGAMREVSLSGVFSDADGDSLTITAVSDDEAIATVSVPSGGSALTLTGVSEGTATITVTAQDSDGNRVSDGFDVSVSRVPEPDPAPTPTPTPEPTPTPTPTPEPEPEPETSDIVARYDANGDGKIDLSELQQAFRDYAVGKITYEEMLEVSNAYARQGSG